MPAKAFVAPLKRELLWRGAFVVAFVVASYFLLAPADHIPDTEHVFPQVDKVEHVASFALLGFLATRAYPRNPAWGVWLALALYGAATEIAQRNVPGRDADVFDALADAVGALAAFVRRGRDQPEGPRDPA